MAGSGFAERSFTGYGHTIDLDPGTNRESGHLHRRAGRKINIPKKCLESLVDERELAHVHAIDGQLHYITQ